MVDGVKVADSHSGRFLHETGLPTRYYLPKTDVRLDLMTPTETATHCPYKGTASYWNVTVAGEVHEEILRDRRHLSADGLLVPVVVIDRASGEMGAAPELVSRGFTHDQAMDALGSLV